VAKSAAAAAAAEPRVAFQVRKMLQLLIMPGVSDLECCMAQGRAICMLLGTCWFVLLYA
jgi:hypothetical protein